MSVVVESAGEFDPISFFLTNPLGMIIVALILFAVIVWFLQKRSKEKWFKPVPISTILKEQTADLIKVTQIRGYWGYLRSGDMSLGKILKVGKLNYIMENPLYKKPTKKKKKADEKIQIEEIINDETKQKHIEKEFYIVKISFNPQSFFIAPFVWILEAFNIGVKYAFIPSEYIKRNTIEGVGFFKQNIDYININPSVPVLSMANVFVYGYWSFKLAREIGFFYEREKELEELVNLPKRIVYLDSTHAKKTESYEEMDKIEAKRFDRKVKNMTGDY